jgi:hypothetical protein
MAVGESDLMELGITIREVLSVTRSLRTGASGLSILAYLPEPMQRRVLAEPDPMGPDRGSTATTTNSSGHSRTFATRETPSGSRSACRDGTTTAARLSRLRPAGGVRSHSIEVPVDRCFLSE